MGISSRSRTSCSTIVFADQKPSSNGSFNSQAENLENIIFSAMKRGLYLLGEDFAQVTFYNLDKRYSLSRPEILRKPERFIEALRDMFGEGARIIEMLIKQAICVEVGLNPSTFKRTGVMHCIRQARCSVAKKLATVDREDLPIQKTVLL